MVETRSERLWRRAKPSRLAPELDSEVGIVEASGETELALPCSARASIFLSIFLSSIILLRFSRKALNLAKGDGIVASAVCVKCREIGMLCDGRNLGDGGDGTFWATHAGATLVAVANGRGEADARNEGKKEGAEGEEVEGEDDSGDEDAEECGDRTRTMGLALAVAAGVGARAPPSRTRFAAASRNTCRATASLSNAFCAAQLASMARIGTSSGSRQSNRRWCRSLDSASAAIAISGEKKEDAAGGDAERGLGTSAGESYTTPPVLGGVRVARILIRAGIYFNIIYLFIYLTAVAVYSIPFFGSLD